MKANIYLNFAGNTEEAFSFYREAFGGDFLSLLRYSEFGAEMKITEAERNLIAHVSLPLGQNMLMGSDVLESLGHDLTRGNDCFISLDAETGEEAERLFAALSEGGFVAMPIEGTEWAEKYGICTDRFGTQWMVGYTGDIQFA